MVQLSAPSPDLIPVQNGKSSEKAPGPNTNSDGFKKALRNEQENRDAGRPAETVENKAKAPGNERTESAVRSDAGGDMRKSSRKSLNQNSDTGGGEIKKILFGVKSGDARPGGLEIHTKPNLLKSALVGTRIKHKESVSDKKGETGTALPGEDRTPVAGLQIQDLLKKTSDEPVRKSAAATEEETESAALRMKPAGVPVSLTNASTQASALQNGESREQSSQIQKDKKKTGTVDTKITVEDRRTIQGHEKNPLLLKEVETGDSPNRVTLELVPQDDVSGMLTRGEQGDSTGRSFSLQTAEEQKGAALLDRQLQDRGTQELTKNIRFVLKDHNEGEIRLILKPEALGKVRINLNLHENHIVGKIIVENSSVRQAFMNNLADLTRALEDSGFSSASLDVSVGGGQTQQQRQFDDGQPVYFSESSLNSMNDQIPVVYEQGGALSQINLVV